MKHVLVVIALALAPLAVACGQAGSAEKEYRVTSSPARDPSLVVGDRATTASNGTTLAVLSYKSPLTVEGTKPRPGFEFSGIEVKGCAGASSENSLMHIGPDAFALRMPGGADLAPEDFGDRVNVEGPALQSMNPLPGECGRGLVAFQTPRDERPDLVLYDEQFVLEKTIVWKVPSGA